MRISVYYIWHEGLPEFVRPVIWPIIIGNKQHVGLSLYRSLQAQYYNLIQPFMGDFCVEDLGTENPLKDHYAPLFKTIFKHTEMAIDNFRSYLEQVEADIILLEERVQN